MTSPTKMRNRQIYKATQALRSKSVAATLSKRLQEKFNRRSIRVVEGDTVAIKRGEHADVSGKVEKVDVSSGRISVSGIKKEKAKGDKFDVMIHASNVTVTALNLKDQKRRDKIGAVDEYEAEAPELRDDARPATTTATGGGAAAAATLQKDYDDDDDIEEIMMDDDAVDDDIEKIMMDDDAVDDDIEKMMMDDDAVDDDIEKMMMDKDMDDNTDDEQNKGADANEHANTPDEDKTNADNSSSSSSSSSSNMQADKTESNGPRSES